MPWLLLFACLFALVALVCVVVAVTGTTQDARAGGVVGAFAVGILALVLLGFGCTTIVSTRNVGIVTSFGRPVGVRDNGIQMKWPWQHVSELDGTIQTDSQTGSFDSSGKCSNGTPVRLANNSTACVDNTIRWRINPSAGDQLFRDYKTNENIKDSLVTRELNATLNQVFASYNPLAPGAAAGPNLTDLSVQATQRLQTKIGAQIEVQNIIISIAHFDSQTQDKINAYQARIADANIAEEGQRVATAEAEANRILSASVSNDPNVLVSKCLDMVSAGKSMPTGFQCWPGGGLPVTIPAH
jgi:regulator of protease activity HflC (stomatin/prohibitin superfamily)